jgi:hypothetical protein
MVRKLVALVANLLAVPLAGAAPSADAISARAAVVYTLLTAGLSATTHVGFPRLRCLTDRKVGIRASLHSLRYDLQGSHIVSVRAQVLGASANPDHGLLGGSSGEQLKPASLHWNVVRLRTPNQQHQ